MQPKLNKYNLYKENIFNIGIFLTQIWFGECNKRLFKIHNHLRLKIGVGRARNF